jgi:hypothetical protein
MAACEARAWLVWTAPHASATNPYVPDQGNQEDQYSEVPQVPHQVLVHYHGGPAHPQKELSLLFSENPPSTHSGE